MAKNKVINTVLNLRDNMSGGLIQAAKNAKKSGAQIDDSMMSATRKVVKFKNDSLKALQSWSKKSVVAAGAAVIVGDPSDSALMQVWEESRHGKA